MKKIDLEDDTVELLKGFAEPLVDTFDTVIRKLAESYKASQSQVPAKAGLPIGMDGKVMIFDCDNPPNLGFTTLTSVILDGTTLEKAETYWNKVMNRLVLAAANDGMSADRIYNLLTVNAIIGEKWDNGFTFLEAAGLSVQGQDSNGAFRQSAALAKELGMELKLFFYWQGNDKAAHPGQRGMFSI